MKSFYDIMTEASSIDDVKTSPPLPAGVYELEITKADPEAELNFDFGDYPKGTKCLEVYLRPVSPVEVDEDELAEVEDWKTKVVSQRYVASEDVAKFMDTTSKRGLVYDAGLDPETFFADGHFDLEDLCRTLKGKRVLGTIVQSPNKKDPERPYVNLKRTAPLE